MNNLVSKKATVKKMQQIIFRIMCDINDFCKKNNIRYYLSGGTCLGAVRHQGFIPWDDDADIMMPREDYERFIILFSKSYSKKYKISSLITNQNWQRPSARVCDLNSRITPTIYKEEPMGVFVDILPIDGLPRGVLWQHLFFLNLRILNALRNSSVRTIYTPEEKFKILKRMLRFITHHIGPRFFAEIMDRYAKHYKFDKSEWVAVSLGVHYWSKEIIKKTYMSESVYCKFEGEDFSIPIGYDLYLSNLYGNYMEIPKDAENNIYPHLDHLIVEFNDG